MSSWPNLYHHVQKVPIFAFIFAACFQKDFFCRTDSLYVEKSSYDSYLQTRGPRATYLTRRIGASGQQGWE